MFLVIGLLRVSVIDLGVCLCKWMMLNVSLLMCMLLLWVSNWFGLIGSGLVLIGWVVVGVLVVVVIVCSVC